MSTNIARNSIMGTNTGLDEIEVFSFDQSEKRELKSIIVNKSYSRGSEITLSSGRKSNFYFNMKPTMLDPRGSVAIATLILAYCQDQKIDYVSGLEMGAVPIICSIAAVSHMLNIPQKTFFVRKEAKGHGKKNQLDSLYDYGDLKDKKVLLVDDVTTTGKSVMTAVNIVRDADGFVDTVLTIVDRLEGAEAELNKNNLKLVSIFTANDFCD